MTELEQCKAILREDARRLCDKSKHPQHPFADCPCSVLRVIERLEAELAEARQAEMRYAAVVDDLLVDIRKLEANQIPGRCRECKHYRREADTGDWTCEGVEPDGFCDGWEARE